MRWHGGRVYPYSRDQKRAWATTRRGGDAGHPDRQRGVASVEKVKLPSLLTLNAGHRTISCFSFGLSIQRYRDAKPPMLVASNDLNAANCLAAGPLSDRVQAFFSKSRVVQSDRC
jgi:hypothetical protein